MAARGSEERRGRGGDSATQTPPGGKLHRVWGQRGSKGVQDVALEVASDAAWVQRVWPGRRGEVAAERAQRETLRIWEALCHSAEMLMSRGRGVSMGVSGCEFCTFNLSRRAWRRQGGAAGSQRRAPEDTTQPVFTSSPMRSPGASPQRSPERDANPATLGVGSSQPTFTLAPNFATTYSLRTTVARPVPTEDRKVESPVTQLTHTDVAQELNLPPEAVRATLKAVFCSIGEGLYRSQVYDLDFGFARVHLDKRSVPETGFHPTYLAALQQFDERRLARERRHEGFLLRSGYGTPMLTEKCYLYPKGWQEDRRERYGDAVNANATASAEDWMSPARDPAAATPTRSASAGGARAGRTATATTAIRTRSASAEKRTGAPRKAFCTASAPKSFDQIAKDLEKPHVRPLLSLTAAKKAAGTRPHGRTPALLQRQLASVEGQIDSLERNKQALRARLAEVEDVEADDAVAAQGPSSRLAQMAPRTLDAVAAATAQPKRRAPSAGGRRPAGAKAKASGVKKAPPANADLIEQVRTGPAGEDAADAPVVTEEFGEGALFAGSPRVEVRSTPRVRVTHTEQPLVMDLETPARAADDFAAMTAAAPTPLQETSVNVVAPPARISLKAKAAAAAAVTTGKITGPRGDAGAPTAGESVNGWECGGFLKFTDGDALKRQTRSAAMAMEEFNRQRAAEVKEKMAKAQEAANHEANLSIQAEVTSLQQQKSVELEEKRARSQKLHAQWAQQVGEHKARSGTVRCF